MILKGRSRAHGGQLAQYLLSPKNELVQIVDVCGTIIDDRTPEGLKQSLREMDELGQMTQASVSLFHLAINPHERDQMTAESWQYSVAKAEKALGLTDHPRAIVSHVYQGKEHFHVVWSRVDVETRKCAEMSFSNRKLCQAAREIESELGLEPMAVKTPTVTPDLPRPKQPAQQIEQHQQERAAQARPERNALIRAAWNQAESGPHFKALVEACGFHLAAGKRGVVVLDACNEAHSISRCVPGLKAKEVRAKLADLELPTVAQQHQNQKRNLARQSELHTVSGQTGGAELARESQLTPVAPRRSHQLTAPEAQRALVVQNESAANGHPAPLSAPLRQAETWQQFKELNQARIEEEQREREKERERQRPGLEMGM